MEVSVIPLICSLSVSIVSCAVRDPKPPKLEAPVSSMGGWTEGRRSFIGPISLKKSEGGKIIGIGVLCPSGEEEDASWESHGGEYRKLDPKKTYDVTFLTRIFQGQGLVQSELLRVEHDGRPIIDESVCHIHGRSMVRQTEVEESAVDYPDGFLQVRRSMFANDGNIYLACSSGINHPTWKCPQCERSFKAYVKRHHIGNH